MTNELMIIMAHKPIECVRIANGEQPIIARKTIPKQFEPPYRVLMFCNKEKAKSKRLCKNCFGKSCCYISYQQHSCDTILNSKVIGEYVVDKTKEVGITTVEGEVNLCFGNTRIVHYCHITEVKIYDEPKDIWDYNHIVKGHKKLSGKQTYVQCRITTAPKNFVYVEEQSE